MAPALNEMDEKAIASEEGVALALSGGGYRAMLFHVGAICRLNEVGLSAGLPGFRACRGVL